MSTASGMVLQAVGRGAWEELMAFVEERRKGNQAAKSFEEFEGQVRKLFAGAEAEVVGEELGRHDVDVPMVKIGGVEHRRVVRAEQSYQTASGEARVLRTLYSTRDGCEPAACPMELSAGVVGGRWTPLAAKQATYVVGQLPPQSAEELFARLGGMTPSKSSLDRLPKELSGRWEEKREGYEGKLREEEEVPAEATSVGVSLDGVLTPMRNGERRKKREAQAAAGKQQKGPAGYFEASCATLTLYDKAGEPLRTVRLGRMPEKKKATLKETLTAELAAVRTRRPDLRVVAVADGSRDNWTYLSQIGAEAEVVDFFHAAEHLHEALVSAYGETHPQGRAQFEKLRHLLRHEEGGVEQVIRALRYLRDQHPRRKKLVENLGYFRRNRHRMQYAALASQKLPIGSGIVEAACKTLVTQRLKQSGMRWGEPGGQAILTLRSLIQSNRFDRAWSLLAEIYRAQVALPENVVPFRKPTPHDSYAKPSE